MAADCGDGPVDGLFCKRKIRMRLNKIILLKIDSQTNDTYCPAFSIPIDLSTPSLSSGIILISTSLDTNNFVYSVASS
jgi:hypothetical protein